MQITYEFYGERVVQSRNFLQAVSEWNRFSQSDKATHRLQIMWDNGSVKSVHFNRQAEIWLLLGIDSTRKEDTLQTASRDWATHEANICDITACSFLTRKINKKENQDVNACSRLSRSYDCHCSQVVHINLRSNSHVKVDLSKHRIPSVRYMAQRDNHMAMTACYEQWHHENLFFWTKEIQNTYFYTWKFFQ